MIFCDDDTDALRRLACTANKIARHRGPKRQAFRPMLLSTTKKGR